MNQRAPTPLSPLPTADNNGIIPLHEYRHACASGSHQLLAKITPEGIELICPRCRTEDKENARAVITEMELILYLLMIQRARK